MVDKILGGMLVLISIMIFAGCAPAYHCYPCGRVEDDYYPQNPLPYAITNIDRCNDSNGQTMVSVASSRAGFNESQKGRDLDYYRDPD